MSQHLVDVKFWSGVFRRWYVLLWITSKCYHLKEAFLGRLLFTMLDHINILAWLAEVSMEVDGLIRLLLEWKKCVSLWISHCGVLIPHDWLQSSVPICLVVPISIFDHILWLWFIHFFCVRSFAIGADFTLLDALSDKIGCSRVIINAIFNSLLHAYWLPIWEWAEDVRSPIKMPRLHLPVRPKLVHFSLIVSVCQCIFLLSNDTDARSPNEESYGWPIADPTFIFQICIDTPLGRARYQLFVSELPLNNHFASLNTRH